MLSTSFGRARGKEKLRRERGEEGRRRREENSWSPNCPSSLSILYYLLVTDDIPMNMDIMFTKILLAHCCGFLKNVFMFSK